MQYLMSLYRCLPRRLQYLDCEHWIILATDYDKTLPSSFKLVEILSSLVSQQQTFESKTWKSFKTRPFTTYD